jgi:cytochrome c553
MRPGLKRLLVLLIAWPIVAESERTVELLEAALALEPDLRQGEKLYRTHCASCHGKRARGEARTVTPALAGQLPIYLMKQMVDFAEANRASDDMHRVPSRKALTGPQAIRDVSAYLGALVRNPSPERGDGAGLEVGKRAYQGFCAFCHGATGEGNEEHATPSLQGQHYSYLLMQSRLISTNHRYSVDFAVSDTLRALPYEYLTAIADYASRLPASASTPASRVDDAGRIE